MNDNIKSKVIGLLENTTARIRNIELLRYELQHRKALTEDEMIEALALGRGDCEGHGKNSVSDNTMRTALDFERKTEQANSDITREIVRELSALEAEQERLEKYISLLSATQQTVIRSVYFEKRNCRLTSNDIGIPFRTVQRALENGVKELCLMYGYIESFKLT